MCVEATDSPNFLPSCEGEKAWRQAARGPAVELLTADAFPLRDATAERRPRLGIVLVAPAGGEATNRSSDPHWRWTDEGVRSVLPRRCERCSRAHFMVDFAAAAQRATQVCTLPLRIRPAEAEGPRSSRTGALPGRAAWGVSLGRAERLGHRSVGPPSIRRAGTGDRPRTRDRPERRAVPPPPSRGPRPACQARLDSVEAGVRRLSPNADGTAEPSSQVLLSVRRYTVHQYR